MKKKFNWNNPITWKGYMEFALGSIIVSFILYILAIIIYKKKLDKLVDAEFNNETESEND